MSTYQSPKILEKGSGQIGFGILAGVGIENQETGLGEISLIGRYGISERMDVGAKLYGMPQLLEFHSFYGDLRHQILTDPIYLSGSMGISTFSVDDFRSIGLYPTVMAGTERLYGGVKWIRLISTSDQTEESLGTHFPGFVAGANFGGRISVMPEVNIYFSEDILVFPGVGLTYRF